MTKQSLRREQIPTGLRGRTNVVRVGSRRERLRHGDAAEVQVGRVISAVVDTVQEVGYARLTVAAIIRRARVSRKTFYELFSDREDCFLAAFDQALREARRAAAGAVASELAWADQVRSVVARLLVFMDEEPGLARLCVVEAQAAGSRVLARRAEVLGELAKLIDRGRSVASPTGEPPALAAETVVGAVFSVLHARLLDDRSTQALGRLQGSLMSMIVLPYLGAGAARRELAKPTPKRTPARASRRQPRGEDPLEGLKMRLTYRTVRVLMFVGEHPGASNRQIAAGAGVDDQGQMSKLLARLARMDLVRNLGDGQKRGMPNAWELTERGARLERASRPRR